MSSASPARQERFPWEPESVNRANLVSAGVRQLLLQKIPATDVRAQSLLVAAGALAGFAAQNSALEQGELLTARRDLVAPESLMLRKNPEGQRFLAGRWINAALLLGYGHGLPLQRFVVQAASQAGAKRTDFADYWELERNIAKAAAEGELGRLEASEDRAPLARPQDLLRVLWPTTRRIIIAPMPLELGDEPPLHEAHWSSILGLVAARLMTQTAQIVPPKLAAGLVMEGAIIASKLDPDLVDRGRWTLAPGPRGLQIARDDRRRVA
ncbi:hypothetical protein [Phenylobacterium sp.]|jgi:hypothetical protein|uniref:hypothetical protein n=1 Tax=Phenylobacterium sp. TaxID=1871053 RepID=UPI002E3067AB|nr:hypothetical protein [Phenylobacterium sp.]HEX3365582.1 hypothetical protein [Phenylobacterium sp.]